VLARAGCPHGEAYNQASFRFEAGALNLRPGGRWFCALLVSWCWLVLSASAVLFVCGCGCWVCVGCVLVAGFVLVGRVNFLGGVCYDQVGVDLYE
jgi:hypothetical protein